MQSNQFIPLTWVTADVRLSQGLEGDQPQPAQAPGSRPDFKIVALGLVKWHGAVVPAVPGGTAQPQAGSTLNCLICSNSRWSRKRQSPLVVLVVCTRWFREPWYPEEQALQPADQCMQTCVAARRL
jgi:hypothetical protein